MERSVELLGMSGIKTASPLHRAKGGRETPNLRGNIADGSLEQPECQSRVRPEGEIHALMSDRAGAIVKVWGPKGLLRIDARLAFHTLTEDRNCGRESGKSQRWLPLNR